ncbi:MAG: hypothetical protein H6648_02905 [Caldilineae bacterium]|nr:hypothetical protein [Caldilineae bacterium]
MGRLISTDSTGTQRQRWRRTIAEALKRLMAKPSLDAEAKDLAALIVIALREIGAGVEQSASAWDKRHYYIKADRLRADWEWTDKAAERLARLIGVDDWVRVPVVLAELAPRFADVDVVKLTRSPRLWEGAYAKLKQEG